MPGGTEADHLVTARMEALRSPASVRGHPIHPMLIPLPIGLLVGALAADVGYWGVGDQMFARMAVWLIGGGLATGLLAAAFGLIDFTVLTRPRQLRAGWVHALGNGVVLAVTAGNLLLRLASGAEQAVLPVGLALSVLVGVLLAVTGWYGGELSYRYLVGVDPGEEVTTDQTRRRPE